MDDVDIQHCYGYEVGTSDLKTSAFFHGPYEVESFEEMERAYNFQMKRENIKETRDVLTWADERQYKTV